MQSCRFDSCYETILDNLQAFDSGLGRRNKYVLIKENDIRMSDWHLYSNPTAQFGLDGAVYNEL